MHMFRIYWRSPFCKQTFYRHLKKVISRASLYFLLMSKGWRGHTQIDETVRNTLLQTLQHGAHAQRAPAGKTPTVRSRCFGSRLRFAAS